MNNMKKFKSLFDQLACHRSYFNTFSNFLDFMMLLFNYNQDREALKKCVAEFDINDANTVLTQMAVLIGEMAEGYRDPLGEFYMLEISRHVHGQYFTPQPVCDMMATLSGVGEGTGTSAYDPACGSGRMLLAAAKINRNLLMYGGELDFTCCRMAVINLLLNSLTGEICHINTLSNELFTGYKVGTVFSMGYRLPIWSKFTDPEKSRIVLRSDKEKAEDKNRIEFV